MGGKTEGDSSSLEGDQEQEERTDEQASRKESGLQAVVLARNEKLFAELKGITVGEAKEARFIRMDLRSKVAKESGRLEVDELEVDLDLNGSVLLQKTDDSPAYQTTIKRQRTFREKKAQESPLSPALGPDEQDMQLTNSTV